MAEVLGTDAGETLNGTSGDDVIDAKGGDDTLNGLGGNDSLDGGDGDDTLVLDGLISGGAYYGGTGTDTLELNATTANVFGAYGSSSAYAFFGATLTGIEQVRFDSDASTGVGAVMLFDQLGGSGITTLIGGDGNDAMGLVAADPGGGTFTMPSFNLVNWDSSANFVNQTGDDLILYASGAGSFTLNAREGLSSAQALLGSDGDDILNGSSGKEILNGQGGANALNGNGGDDVLVIANTVDAQGNVTALTGAGSVYDGGSGIDTLWVGGPVNFQGSVAGIEAIFLQAAYSSPAPMGAGSYPATVLSLSGSLLAALPADLALSGTGTIVVNLTPGDAYNAAAWSVAPGSTISVQVNGSSVNDTMTGSSLDETLVSAGGNDALKAGAGNDVLRGGLGDDLLSGGAGVDIASYAGLGGAVHVSLGVTGAQDTGAGGIDTLSGIENLVGTNYADTLTGNARANTLDGGGGADTLTGGAGNDTYWVNAKADVVVEASGGGTDTVHASSSYTLSANVENLTLTGTANISGTGNALNNQLTGNAGNNALDGGVGADTMTGGLGNDTFRVDNAGDALVEGAGGGTDTVMASIGFTLGTNFENLILTGNAAIDGTGSGHDNAITGNAAVNTLSGLAGNDTLTGGGGADALDGGSGADVLNGGTGSDSLTGGFGADTFVYTLTSDTTVGHRDTIEDFSHAQHDLIDLSAIDAVAGGSNDAFTLSDAFHHSAGELIVSAIATGEYRVLGDVNGDATADFAIEVYSATALTAVDFAL